MMRFHGFHTSIFEMGNGKPRDGTGQFTDFTDFTPSEREGYVPGTHSLPPAGAPGPHTYPISTRCEIREIREIAGRRGGKSPRFRPPGVKGVKSTPECDMEATL